MAFIDDGTYSWEEVYLELCSYIENEIYKSKDNNEIYSNLKLFKEFIYDIIHNKLYKNREIEENEKKIRDICKYVIVKILPFITNKIVEMDTRLSRIGGDIELAKLTSNLYELEDDFYAIASFRSLMHYANYMERADDKSQWVWKYNMNTTMGGVFYYSNQMILDNKYSNLIKQCPTGYGKCVDENTIVMTPKGNVKIKDLNIGDIVYSMKDNKLTTRKILNKWNTTKKAIKLKTKSRKEIVLSEEHKMYTQRGYVKAKDLTSEDYLYSLLGKIDNDKIIDKDELIFISCMLFDGGCTEEFFSFTQEENLMKDVFLNSCNKLGLIYKVAKKLNSKADTYWFHKKDGKVRELLKKYDIYGCKAYNKRLPKIFYQLSLKQKYDFISVMFATDGYITNENNCELCGIGLASEKLIDDIQLLLSTCGIFSKKRYKRSKTNGKCFDGWVLEVPNEYLKVIYENCYLYHKQQKLEKKYNFIFKNKVSSYSNSTNYPKELLKKCKEFKKENNKQWARNQTFKRDIVEEFNDRTHLLEDVVYKDFIYDKIISIEYSNLEIPMVDIEVEETHNFIANGFVSHNSKSDCIIITFCFGYDVNDDVMKIVGNKTLVKPITQSIVKMLKSKRFGKVFPEFGKYNGGNEMFKNCAETDGTFTLADSKKSQSFACFNKETPIDGGRFNKQFYDDITQSDDRENVNAHMRDRNKYESQWKKRQYDEFSCLRWFTGTAYHREDFLSYIRKEKANGKELLLEPSTSKCQWNKFVRTNTTKDTIYVSVPKLADLELGEDKCYCTFPQKYSKESALKEFHSSLSSKRRFMAMEQQMPLPPESLAFDYAYLNQYEILPQSIKDNNCDTYVIIDPNRKGRDNYAGLIFKKPYDEEKYYFVDCFYKKVSSKIAVPKICEKASYHKADIIAFETNTVDTYQMKKEIKTYMLENNWNDYSIKDFYSTLNKEDKISKYSDDIREKIVFPKQGMYYEDSDMGRAMSDIVNYSFDTKQQHDDSIDVCAMLMILVATKTKNTISTLKFRL